MNAIGLNVTSRQRWAGRIVSAVPILFLLLDGVMKLFKPSFVVKTTTELGFPESTIVGIGVVLLASIVLHLVPRTSFLGVLLLTAYLGGAVASKVRVGANLRHRVRIDSCCAFVDRLLAARSERARALSPPALTQE